jgi:tetratricopeptide (TPR) repeat protein
VTDRLLVDLRAGARVAVSAWPEGGVPETVAEMPLAWPLDDHALEHLRWYLEDYLTAPFGVWEDRGPWVADQLAAWGGEVFASVFSHGAARDAWRQFTGRHVEIVFRSAAAELLGLPWELMRDSSGPVALSPAGISRSLPDADLAQAAVVSRRRLRLLLVISRPSRKRDVPYRMIARQLVQLLEAARGAVDLVVLRPPTLAALRQALTAAVDAGEPFHIVHFDGHGAMVTDDAGQAQPGVPSPAASWPGPQGTLVFEQSEYGGSDAVPAPEIARVMKQGQVPLVVLNACQSGAIGKQVEASVAARLLQEGTTAVVAMGYSVRAVAAAEFMAAFYDRLFSGESVSAAVSAGRRNMSDHDQRPSPKGEVPLADWLVPVHYLRADVRFPQMTEGRPASVPSLAALRRPHAAIRPAGHDVQGEEHAFRFVGRDDLFYELEAAMATSHVAVLYGMAGAGKTELARAFGRWWEDTCGTDLPDGVVWHSFTQGEASSGLDSMITRIGVQVTGRDFARLPPAERYPAACRLLATRRLLLIWDGFESACCMPGPGGGASVPDEVGRAEMKRFLHQVIASGSSAVIITSRTAEDWLGPARPILVGGLGREDAAQHAAQILASNPAGQRQQGQRDFGELLAWLQGHPRSMQQVLPCLQTASAAALLEGLRGAIPLPGDTIPGTDRDTSPAASISDSFSQLTDTTRQLLPALCLACGVVSIGVLAVFSGMDGIPPEFAGATIQDWARALDDADRAGLLSPLGRGLYQVHPLLPAYLAARWRASSPDSYGSARGAAARALIAAYDAFAGWTGRALESGDTALALQILMLQERAIIATFNYALEHRLWDSVQDTAKLLNLYWDARGLESEAAAWTEQVRAATEQADGTPPRPDSPAGRVWLLFASADAGRQRRNLRLDDAERTYRQILDTFRSSPAPEQRMAVAATLQELGAIAYLRGRVEDAEDRYRESLAISENLDDPQGMAASCHQLGVLAQRQGYLDEAEQLYRKSLAASENLDDRQGMAASCHQLGNVCQLRGDLDAAAGWYAKSLRICQDLGDLPRTALIYHQLGRTAHDQGRLGEAEGWYLESLRLNERITNRPGLVHDYHQIGELAEQRGELGDAEGWYRKALDIARDIGDRSAAAAACHALGTIAYLGRRLREAEDWYLRSLALFDEDGDQSNVAASYFQLGMTARSRGRLQIAGHWYHRYLDIAGELGDQTGLERGYRHLSSLAEQRGNLEEALDWAIRGLAHCRDLTGPATEPERAQLARLTASLGASVLHARWQDITGTALPPGLSRHAARPQTGHAQQEGQ